MLTTAGAASKVIAANSVPATPSRRAAPRRESGDYAGDAAPQQIAVAAQHFSGQQESAEAQPENMRMGENGSAIMIFSVRQNLL